MTPAARLEALTLALGERKVLELIALAARNPKAKLTADERELAAQRVRWVVGGEL